MSKFCISTGGTAGIGLATARAMHDAGYHVYELSRREAGTDCAVHIQACLLYTSRCVYETAPANSIVLRFKT